MYHPCPFQHVVMFIVVNAALEELGNLNDLDLERIYVSSFSNVRGGGDFLVLDERTGSRTMVASTFPQVMVVSITNKFLYELQVLLVLYNSFIFPFHILNILQYSPGPDSC